MKKSIKIILLAVLLIGSYSAQAQIKWGVKAGFNTSNVAGMEELGEQTFNSFETNYRAGFHGGLMAQIAIPATNVFIQPELLYSLQGFKSKAEFEYYIPAPPFLQGGTISGTDDLEYIQLPIYLGYKFNAGLGLNVIAGVGPYFAYGIHASDDAFDSMKRFDFGFSAMAGIQFSKLQITLGYDLGITDMMDINGWNTAKDVLGLSSIQNRNLKLSLGYFF